MTNHALFESGMGRSTVLGHTRVDADAVSGGVPLPNLPNDNRVRRTVLRSKGDFEWTADGSDPALGGGMYGLADEVMVYDGDPALIRLWATATTDVRIIYMGT